MFGISFSELLLVSLVALLVLGPERLPGAARTAGLWIGRLKRSFNSIRMEVEREIGADDIRRQLHNEHILSMEQEARRILDPKTASSAPASAATQADADPAAVAPAITAPTADANEVAAKSGAQPDLPKPSEPPKNP